MLTEAETRAALAALVDGGTVTRAEVARALELPPPRITQILAGERLIKLDEAKVLHDRYGIGRKPTAAAISDAHARILVRHVARVLDAPCTEAQLRELAQDATALFALFQGAAVPPSADHALGLLEGRMSARTETRQ